MKLSVFSALSMAAAILAISSSLLQSVAGDSLLRTNAMETSVARRISHKGNETDVAPTEASPTAPAESPTAPAESPTAPAETPAPSKTPSAESPVEPPHEEPEQTTKEMPEETPTEEPEQGPTKKSRRRRIIKIVGITVAAVVGVCIIVYGVNMYRKRAGYETVSTS